MTSRTVPMPPAKASSCTTPRPSQALPAPSARAGRMSGSTMPTVAPSDAPAAVPMMYGSAIGLRRMAWKTVPAEASPAPTTMAPRTRGRRSSITIVSTLPLTPAPEPIPSSRCPSTPSTSSGLIATLPSPMPATMAASRSAPPPPIARAARPMAGPRTMGRGATSARIGSALQGPGVDGTGQRLQPIDDPRPGPRDHHVVGHDHDPAVGHRRHRLPAGALRDGLGGDARVVRCVTEQDQLRIGRHQLLELDGGRERVAGDRLAAGRLDQAGKERALARGVDGALEDADLVERARCVLAGHRLLDRGDAGLHVLDQGLRRVGASKGGTHQLDVGGDLGEGLRIQDQ